MSQSSQTAHPSTRRPLIAVIGDAKLEPGSVKDKLAEDIGRALVDAGYRVLTGGLGGVMEAASRGARSSSKYRSGDTVGVVPGHDPGEANAFVDVVLASGLDHVRNSIVAHADAVIAIGGGAGTMSEICFAWIYKRLIIGMRVEGWSGRMADQRVDERTRYPNEADDRIFGADSADDVVRILADRLARFADHHRGVRRRD
jgi:uncharacterized protein (TIGR00725 family)